MAGLPSGGGQLHALYANPRGKHLYCVPFKAPKALIDALIAQRLNKQAAGTIQWEGPAGSTPCTLSIGSSTWNTSCLHESQLCDVLLAPQGFPAPSAKHRALCELGRVACKLQVERTLDDNTAQRFKSRQEEEEQRGRERQTKVLNQARGRAVTPPPRGQRALTPPPGVRRTPTPPPSSRRAPTSSMGPKRGTTPPPPGAALILGGAAARATTPPPVFVRATTPPPLTNHSTTKPRAGTYVWHAC